jgi:hypothetical protein
MDMTKAVRIVMGALLVVGGSVVGAEQTWTGKISDNLCGAKHEPAAEGQATPSDKECTLACVRGGSKFALVAADGNVYEFSNQDFKDLATFAGDKVKVTGEKKGSAIAVTKIEKSE